MLDEVGVDKGSWEEEAERCFVVEVVAGFGIVEGSSMVGFGLGMRHVAQVLLLCMCVVWRGRREGAVSQGIRAGRVTKSLDSIRRGW